MNNNVNYNDIIYRNFVKEIFYNQFDIELIDTPDSYFKISESNEERPFIEGKYNFDLIPKNPISSFVFVEVETAREKYSVFDNESKTFNILVSKYWKYCTCSSKPGMIVYVQINDDLNPTGKFALINSADILAKCDITKYHVKSSDVNFRGKVALYEVPKKGIVQYFDVNEFVEKKRKTSKLIKVNEKTRNLYWNKYQNYAIDDNDLNKYDVLRFQGYSNKSPFEEEKFEYYIDANKLRPYLFKLSNTDGYYLISNKNIEKYAEKIEI